MLLYYERAVLRDFESKLKPNKVLILLGARRVGKTKLIKKYLETTKEKFLQLNGEDLNDARLLEDRSVSNYSKLLQGISILVIDEAQNIAEIGLILKFIVDQIEGIKIIATGSSMFDLANKLGEPLVGRKHTLFLFPLSQIEFSKYENYKQTTENLEERLIYGGYPELTQYESWYDKKDYLKEIVNSYLLKDILVFDGIKNSDKIYDLLRMIAFRIGSEISVESIGRELDLNKSTVSRYLDLLSKVFIIYNLNGFSRNLDNEITKMGKWYFHDNGIRNALINNFNPLNMRDDHGKLWENYLVSERLKLNEYTRLHAANFFWRTHTQQEIDWIEDRGGKLHAYEFKCGKTKKSKIPPQWAKAYPDSEFQVVDRDSYLEFILG